jgi:ribosome biogenesis GTPase
MQKLELEALRGIGLSLAAAQQLIHDGPAHPGTRPVRLTQVHRETVWLDDGLSEHSARIAPPLARRLAADGQTAAVGDWGLARADAHGDWWFVHRLAPQTVLARRDAHGLRHVLVSNVDTALLVMGLDADFSPRRIERFLALVQAARVEPVVVLTKADVGADVSGVVAQLRARLPEAVCCLAVDARSPQAAQALAPWLRPGRTLVLLGSSGAGKSTLSNTLIGDEVQPTGAARKGDGRGRHTTTARSLHRLPGDACLIDTPGVRALRPDGDEDALAASFDDVTRLALQCRFRDCRHGDEPGCAVRGSVDDDRLRNFHKLQRELRRDTMSALERQRERSAWKARGRLGQANLRAKRGE